MEKVQEELIDLNKNLPDQNLAKINEALLSDSRFFIWPASCGNHHCFRGGLASHTLEVIYYASNACKLNSKIDWPIVFTSCLWHDYAKIFDYYWGKNEKGEEKWLHNSHYNRIRHIARSYYEFMKVADQNNHLPNKLKEDISHCILSHHRFADFGSPVEPKTLEAWTIHLADSFSAFCGATANRPK